ncbi:uncharacterized protein BDW47DRAFT_39982 [Aspergillus candidus]|uniref:Uncharacterized protein n=1 Tax=Aspergillus candidus TaxID=41067 RepID=A0A2I2F915_ASPCN|nr:hypothetical protein BDW47DRAFT_39982 [Aspergillus candidus]PLB37113.1 hypothetical protein BDW47DRAFT_39982 [Aspergillus candidus]
MDRFGRYSTIHQIMCSCAFSPPHQSSPIEVQTAESRLWGNTSHANSRRFGLISGQWPHHWPCSLRQARVRRT